MINKTMAFLIPFVCMILLLISNEIFDLSYEIFGSLTILIILSHSLLKAYSKDNEMKRNNKEHAKTDSN